MKKHAGLASLILMAATLARAGEGFNAVDRASAASAVRVLALIPAGALGGHPLGAALSGVDVESPAARQRLAPFVEALAAAGASPAPDGVKRALAAASLAVSRQSQALIERAARTSPTDLNAWKALSGDLDAFAATYGGYLSAHEALVLDGEAEAARARVEGLRAGQIMERTQREAEILNQDKKSESVAAPQAGAQVPGSELSQSAPRVDAGQTPVTVPAPAAPQKAAEKADRFSLVTAAYYLGGSFVLAAMLLLPAMNAASLGAGGLFTVAAAYGSLFTLAGLGLKKRGYPVAGGVLATAAAASAPVVVYFLESAMGWWDAQSMNAANLLMLPILGSLLAAAVAAAKKFKFAFLAMPAAVALVGLPIVVANMLGVSTNIADSPLRVMLAVSGAAIVAAGAWLKKRAPDVDYGFWLSLAGGGLFLYAVAALLGAGTLAFAVASALTIAAGAILDRRSLALYGGLGVFYYTGSLVLRWFGDTQMLPFALIALGGGLIAGAVMFQRKFQALQDFLRARLRLG